MDYQRDRLINRVFEKAKKDKNIFFLSADFGAPSLDRFRSDLSEQFVHTGISEQNMIDLAAGLALDGRKVFVYGMAPFVTLRCLEQHKCATGIMNLNVCTIVAGIGLGYADAGPTHYATEDLGCLRSLINSKISTASDPDVADLLALDFIKNPSYSFIRLDRHPLPYIKNKIKFEDITRGYRILEENNSVCVLSNGGIINNVIEANKISSKKFTIIDVIRVKPINNALFEKLKEYKYIVTVDEQSSSGGLNSAIMEGLNDNNILKSVKSIKLPEKYFFENGGRDYLLKLSGLLPEQIAETINSL